jgi:hypothetical protein
LIRTRIPGRLYTRVSITPSFSSRLSNGIFIMSELESGGRMVQMKGGHTQSHPERTTLSVSPS